MPPGCAAPSAALAGESVRRHAGQLPRCRVRRLRLLHQRARLRLSAGARPRPGGRSSCWPAGSPTPRSGRRATPLWDERLRLATPGGLADGSGRLDRAGRRRRARPCCRLVADRGGAGGPGPGRGRHLAWPTARSDPDRAAAGDRAGVGDRRGPRTALLPAQRTRPGGRGAAGRSAGPAQPGVRTRTDARSPSATSSAAGPAGTPSQVRLLLFGPAPHTDDDLVELTRSLDRLEQEARQL